MDVDLRQRGGRKLEALNKYEFDFWNQTLAEDGAWRTVFHQTRWSDPYRQVRCESALSIQCGELTQSIHCSASARRTGWRQRSRSRASSIVSLPWVEPDNFRGLSAAA